MKHTNYTIGQTVTANLYLSSGKKVKVKGKVKGFTELFGRRDYHITGGVVEDFITSKIN